MSWQEYLKVLEQRLAKAENNYLHSQHHIAKNWQRGQISALKDVIADLRHFIEQEKKVN